MVATVASDKWWVRFSWLWLGLLVPSLVFSNGRWQLAIAAVASPALARLFLFSQPAVRGLLVLLFLQLGAFMVMWWEIIPAPGVLYYIIAAAYGVCYFIPFVIDRIASTRIGGFASTLVLPLSWFLVEILIQLLTPYGTWTSAGYTQMGHGLLTPLAAWLGVAGVAFVTVWLGSAASWFVMAAAPARRRAVTLAVWAGAIAISIWLARTLPASDSSMVGNVTVAGVTPSYEATSAVDRAVHAAMRSGEMNRADMDHIESLISDLNESLFARSREAARGGARLVVWSEIAGRVLGSEEDDLVARGQALAREEGTYLFMGLGVWHPGSQPPLENKVIAVEPSGEIAWSYRKARPIVGAEAPLIPPGHDDLATLESPYGRIGLVICHDLDFADYVTQAGRSDVDLLLAPSADWFVIADLHARMGIMRAVENGFWLFRPVYAGLSVIASPEGQVTRSAYDVELEERVFAGRIPVRRSSTVYPVVGPYLPFVAAAVLLGLLVLAWRSSSS